MRSLMHEMTPSLLRVAKLLVGESEPDATAERLLRELCELTGADRGFVVVREGERYEQKFDVNFARARVSEEERRFSRTLVQRAISDGRAIATERPADDPQFAGIESVGALGAASVRVAPLLCDGHTVAVIYLERRSGAFAPYVVDLLVEVGELAGPLIKRALERDALKRRNRHLERDLFKQHDFEGIVTRDPRMLELLRVVGQVADTDTSVLVRGETGTGKELIARALHVNSARRRKPFVTLHCAALPSTLLESELFGHVRGAFTGADRDRVGRLASAEGGTLLLDEIGEISHEAQAKLLRFLQFGELQRVGSDRTETVDVRVVAATHRDLGAMVRDDKFRSDLYFRLKVIELVVPPLRDRRADIPFLVDAFVTQKWRERPGIPRLTARAEQALRSYDYPGNVRELEHLIERACILANGTDLDVDVLPSELHPAMPVALGPFTRFDAAELEAARAEAIAAIEREFVTGLVDRHGGNVSQAARASGMNRTHLQKLLARYRRC
jgi:Nif-specific regulatory protein/two-component system response regulator HydG